MTAALGVLLLGLGLLVVVPFTSVLWAEVYRTLGGERDQPAE